jgi:hypothetical protein
VTKKRSLDRTLGSSVPAVLLGPAKQAGWKVESYPKSLGFYKMSSVIAEPMFTHLVSPLEHFARGVGAAMFLACILVQGLQAAIAHDCTCSIVKWWSVWSVWVGGVGCCCRAWASTP